MISGGLNGGHIAYVVGFATGLGLTFTLIGTFTGGVMVGGGLVFLAFILVLALALAALMAFILTILDDDKSKGCFTSGLFTGLGMYGAISGLKAILNKVLKEGILNGFGFAGALYGLGNDFEDCVL